MRKMECLLVSMHHLLHQSPEPVVIVHVPSYAAFVPNEEIYVS